MAKTTKPEPIKEPKDQVVKKEAQPDKMVPEKPEVKAPKTTKPHPKAMNKQRSRRYLKAAALKKSDKAYSPEEAIKFITKLSYANFDASLDLHINTNNKKGVLAKVKLPHGTGKTKRITIVNDETLKAIQAGKLEFDVLITHPQYMPKLAKFARVLGPKGLMPNPKNGTISPEPEKVKLEMEKGGLLTVKTEAKAYVAHASIGRLSFNQKHLLENLMAVLKALKPSEIKSVYIAPTMGPSVKITFPLAKL